MPIVWLRSLVSLSFPYLVLVGDVEPPQTIEEAIDRILSKSVPRTMGEIKDQLAGFGFEVGYALLTPTLAMMTQQQKIRACWTAGTVPVRVFFRV